MRSTYLVVIPIVLASAAFAGDTTPQKLLSGFEAAAGGSGSAARGKTLFTSKHCGGKPETPSCITCHTTNLRAMGRTRVGKPIDPMALSANPARLSDQAKVAKWFRRNCKSVLGRECSAQEKADVVAYLMSL